MPAHDESSAAFGLEFTSSFVREVGEGAVPQKIPVSTIRRCEIRYGSISKRPRLQLVVGLVMCSAVYFVFKVALTFISTGSYTGGKVVFGTMLLSLVGAWLVSDALQKSHYLFVATDTEEIHLRLLQPLDEGAIEALKQSARQGSGLQVEAHAGAGAGLRGAGAMR